MVLAASCCQCCTSRLNTVRNAAVSGTSSETSSYSRSGRNMSSVRIGYSADSEAGVWPGYHTHCGWLARLETIWVMVTDSTVDSGGTSACLPHPARARDCWLMGSAISMGATRSVTTTWLARTGTTAGTR